MPINKIKIFNSLKELQSKPIYTETDRIEAKKVFANVKKIFEPTKKLQKEDAAKIDFVCSKYAGKSNELQKEDVRNVYLTFLKYMPDEMVLKALELDKWESKGRVEEARKRIIRCFKERNEELDLSGLKLTSLPPCLGHLTWLGNLDCSFNELTELPLEIRQCANLIELICRSNKLKTLPKEIGNCKKLEQLYCANNELTELPAEIGQCANLIGLKCSFNKLKALPKEIGNCKKLKQLYCGNNELTELPAEIGQCANLIKLICISNKLKTLPKEIGNCKKLACLCCDNNKLTELPAEIGQMIWLKHIECSQNNLTELPAEIGQCANLKLLNCSFNELKALPKELASCRELKKLDCSFNELAELPSELDQCTLLRSFDCTYNELTEFSPALAQKFELGTQEIGGILNHFKKIAGSAAFQNLDIKKLLKEDFYIQISKTWLLNLLTAGEFQDSQMRPQIAEQVLTVLQLAGEDFSYQGILKAFLKCDEKASLHPALRKYMPDEMIFNGLDLDIWESKGKVEKARQRIIHCFKERNERLDLSRLELTSLPACLGQMTWLTILDCSYNKVIALPKKIGQCLNLKEFKCSGNKLKKLPKEIENCKKLERLICAENEITELPAEIGLCVNLKLLACESNQLKKLPKEIWDCKKLTYLDCSNNEFEELPVEIGQCVDLERLYYKKNYLQTLPKEVGNCKKLKCFDCSDNELTELPVEIGQCVNLDTINCAKNRLKTLPKQLENCKNLKDLDFSYNELAELPSELGQCIHLMFLNCCYNELAELPPMLSHKFDLGVQRGNPIFKRFKRAAGPGVFQYLDMKKIEKEDPQLSLTIEVWLKKLLTAKEFKDTKMRPHFAAQVLTVLQFACENSDYREILKGYLMTEATTRCVDRASLHLNYLGIQKKIIESRNGSLENLIKILKGSFALSMLDQVSRDFMKQHPDVDEIEVYLGFQMQLKETLDLPLLLNEMSFFPCSNISYDDLWLAWADVRNALQNSEQLVQFFVDEPIWGEKLIKTFAKEHEVELKPIQVELEKLDDAISQMSEQEYKTKAELLAAKYALSEKAWLRSKAEQLLKVEAAFDGKAV